MHASQVPAYWTCMLMGLLGTSRRLAEELWQSYCVLYPHTATTTAYQLGLIADGLCASASVGVMDERLQHCQQLLLPRDLFAASLRLAPEGGRRRGDVVRFEQQVLRYISADGRWR